MNLIRTVLFSLLVSTPALAQCNGLHPAGVITLIGQGCNEITNTGVSPWFSFFTLPSASQSVLVQASVDRTPDYPTAPAIYTGFVYFGLTGVLPGIQFPTTSLPTCLWFTPPDIVWSPVVIPVDPNCQSVAFAVVPPLAGLQGLPIYSQLAMFDGTQGKWAVSRQILFQIQP